MHLSIIIIILALLPNRGLSDNELNKYDSSGSYCSSIASENQGIFQNYSFYEAEYTNTTGMQYYPKSKSSNVATLLAIFPGFLVHGCGHFYAGDVKTGFILLGTEGISVSCLFLVGIADAFSNNDSNERPALRGILLMSGLAGFFGSWIYDMVHSGTAAENYNNKLINHITFESNQNGIIKISLTFFL